MGFVRAADLDSLWPGEMVGVRVGDVKVLLVNVGGAILAYEDRCPHRRFELSKGRLAGNILTCAAHEWQYDLCTGRGVNPAQARLIELKVKIEDAQILVDASDAASS